MISFEDRVYLGERIYDGVCDMNERRNVRAVKLARKW
jgi:hypothetical protein